MKRKKMKPVRAWCLTHDGVIWPNWTKETRAEIEYDLDGETERGDRIIRVEIREVPHKTKRKRKP